MDKMRMARIIFQSSPSVGRATLCYSRRLRTDLDISILALRGEGDRGGGFF